MFCDSAEGWDQTDRHKRYLQMVNLHHHFWLSPLYQRLHTHVVFWNMFYTLSDKVSRGYMIGPQHEYPGIHLIKWYDWLSEYIDACVQTCVIWLAIDATNSTQFRLVPHICVSEAPVWIKNSTGTKYGFLSNGLLGTNFSEIWIKILHVSFMKMHLNVSSAKWRPFCSGGVTEICSIVM